MWLLVTSQHRKSTIFFQKEPKNFNNVEHNWLEIVHDALCNHPATNHCYHQTLKLKKREKNLWKFHLYLIRRTIKNPLFWLYITKVISQSLDRLPTTSLIFISFKIKQTQNFRFFGQNVVVVVGIKWFRYDTFTHEIRMK